MKALFFLLAIYFTADFGHGADPVSESMCRDQLSFQTCYQASEDQCLKWADQAVQSCIVRMPQRPLPPAAIDDLPQSEFGQWNVSLGHCAEQSFETSHQDKFTATPECSSLLSERQANRKNAQAQMTSRFRARNKMTNAQVLMMTLPPLLIGMLASFLYLSRRSRVAYVTSLYGLLSWLIFLFSAFLAEIVTHRLFPALYSGLGDNPSQMAGFFIVMFLSPFLNLLMWSYVRSKSRHLKRASGASVKN
ncbi:MAG: hypothetical protein ACXWC9_04345 [Pseudobdellovibrionaceae bacterium]